MYTSYILLLLFNLVSIKSLMRHVPALCLKCLCFRFKHDTALTYPRSLPFLSSFQAKLNCFRTCTHYFPKMDEEDFSSISVIDRASHSSWKARLSAYEEMSKGISTQYSMLLVGIAKEKNQIALETGLLVIKNCENKVAVKDTIPHILLSLASNRSTTKERILEIILTLIGDSEAEYVIV